MVILSIFSDTLNFLRDKLEETFDKDDEIVSREMSKILENEVDREIFYNAVEELENNKASNVEIKFSNGQEIDIIMK